MKIIERKFVAYFYFQSWAHIQLGLHISLKLPNIEIHIPFGFFRIGMEGKYLYSYQEYKDCSLKKTIGIK